MARIYPDTNSFVDFYQAALENVDIFSELKSQAGRLVLTEQTVMEFRRNRVSTLKRVVSAFRKSVEIPPPYTTSVLRALPGHKELTEYCNEYKRKAKEVLKSLERLVADEPADPIAKEFLGLVSDPSTLKLPVTDRAFEKAHRRKLLGNPPTSEQRYSCGDEVVWEVLLEGMKEDLIVVSRDHTYLDNVSLLQEEYASRTGKKLLLVTERLSEGLKALGEVPSKELIEVEDKFKENAVWVQPHCNCPGGRGRLRWMRDGRFLVNRCLDCGQAVSAFEEDNED